MLTLIVPALSELLAAEETPVYPYSKTYTQAKNDPFVVLNTSGSSGRPKPISLSYGTVSYHDLFLRAPKLSGKALNTCYFSGKRVFIGLPLFHSAAMCFLTFAIHSETTPALPSWPISAATANQAHLHARVDSSFLIPNVLADIGRNPEYAENTKNLRYLTFGGAPFPKEWGNRLKDFTHLLFLFGTTEIGFYALEQIDRED